MPYREIFSDIFQQKKFSAILIKNEEANLENNSIKKILIVRLSAIGDTIHTLPLAYAIRNKFPDSQLDWIVEDKASAFVLNNPLLNNVFVLERKKWKKSLNKLQNLKEFFGIVKKIRKENYDVVIDVQQLLKSSLILGLSKGKRKITLDGGREFSWIFANEIIKTNKQAFDINYHVVKRNLEIAKYLDCEYEEPVFIIPDFSNQISQEVKTIIKNLDKTKKTIVIAPFTTWENKHWNNQGWQKLIEEFHKTCNILITAGENDKNRIREILPSLPVLNVTNLAGLTSLADLTYIYKKADLLISPDSGSAHIAWASSCPAVLALFFSTSAKRTAPFGAKYYSLSANINCSPCMKKKCKLRNNKNLCSLKISAEEIINIVKTILQ